MSRVSQWVPIVVLVAVVAVGGAAAWLLLSSPEETASDRPRQSPSEREDESTSPEPTPSATPAGSLETRVFGSRDPAAWFRALGDTLVQSGDSDRAEAIRYAIRHRFARETVDLQQLLEETESEVARREVVPLYIDVHGHGLAAASIGSLMTAQPASVRSATYFRLARLGPEGRRTLSELLAGETETSAGTDALAWLLQRGHEDPLDLARNVASSKEAAIFTTIAASLNQPGDPLIRKALDDFLLLDLPYKTREAVADAIAASYPKELRERPASHAELFTRCRSEDPVVRALALRRAGDFMDSWKKENPPQEAVLEVRRLVREAVTSDRDPMVRRAAVLSRVGLRPGIRDLKTQCAVLLEHAGDDPDPGVRAAVLHRVRLGSGRGPMPMGPGFLDRYVRSDPDPDVRREACRMLARWHGHEEHEEKARRLLLSALDQDRDSAVRLECAALLTELGYEKARPHLIRVARSDPDDGVRERLYQSIVEQIAYGDPELIRELAGAIPERQADMEGLPERPGAGTDRDLLRLIPDYRRITKRLSLPGFSPGRGLPAPESFEKHPGWLNAEIAFSCPDEGPLLHGVLQYPSGEPARTLLVVPSNPLEGGSRSPVTREGVRALARANGWATFTFDYRGRGRSEGAAGTDGAEKADVGAAWSWVCEPRNRGKLAECRLTGPACVLALGRGAEYARALEVPESSILVIEGLEGPPESDADAFRRATRERNGSSALRAWLGAHRRR